MLHNNYNKKIIIIKCFNLLFSSQLSTNHRSSLIYSRFSIFSLFSWK